MFRKHNGIVLFALLAGFGITYAADTPVSSATKTYFLTQLQSVTSNSPRCESLYRDLQQLTKKSVNLEFTQVDKKNFVVKDLAGKLVDHNYSIVKQKVKGHLVNRIGMGSFTINNKQINYVIEIAGNTDQKNYDYLYPMILSSDNGRCTYTGVVKPNPETITLLKKNIIDGHVTN